MEQVTLADAKARFDDLAARAAAGETITVTRDGRPAFVMAPAETPAQSGGVDFEAGEAFLRAHGVTRGKTWIAPDFDDPLPEDFLLRPLPPDT